MMIRILNRAIVLILAMLCLTSCFKKEVQGTLLKIAVYGKEVETDEATKTKTDLMAYAFNVKKGSTWQVASWEDAINQQISNENNPSEVRTNPEVIGTVNREEDYQITLDVRAEWVFLVVVDLENKLYATRLYETPINLHETYVQLHLYSYKKTGTTNGWDFINAELDSESDDVTE
jgi:hypothetical protein